MTPTRACVCRLGDGRIRHAAIWAAGSPDEAQQAADFDRDHSGPGHERVERLPKQHGDPAWGWAPGSALPFPGQELPPLRNTTNPIRVGGSAGLDHASRVRPSGAFS